MPRGNQAAAEHQLVRGLAIGDGKCGKTDWAARAVLGGFNVLYLDGDVGSQTIAGLPKDKKNPVPVKMMDQIYILNVSDVLINGGLDYRFVNTFKKFATASPNFRWNDTKSREFDLMKDTDSERKTSDEIWEIKPAYMDHTCVWVIDSWTSLVQSAMAWAADSLGFGMEEPDRDKMRSVYQAAGEKLTHYLTLIRSAPCHVIVLSHPNEFVKTESPTGKTIRDIKETDRKVLWTKMLPKSTSNNHAMQMAKYFTDLMWFEVSAMGEYRIDYRANNERLSGSHIKEVLDSRSGGSFVDLVRAIGGTIPIESGGVRDTSRWLTIHESGFQLDNPAAKPGLVLGAKPAAPSPIKSGGLNLSLTKR